MQENCCKSRGPRHASVRAVNRFLIFSCAIIAASLAVIAFAGCDQGSVNPDGASPANGLAPVARVPGPVPTSTPTPTPTPTPAPAPAPTPGPPNPFPASSLAIQVFNLTNDFRAANGVAPLVLNPMLTTSAQSFAELMEQLKFFAHNSPDGTTPGQRMEAAGFTNWTAWGENIAVGYTTAEDVVNGWINSPGHRANLLDSNFKELGVGNTTGGSPYWVQDFGAR